MVGEQVHMLIQTVIFDDWIVYSTGYSTTEHEISLGVTLEKSTYIVET
jgi:hypothetical protein